MITPLHCLSALLATDGCLWLIMMSEKERTNEGMQKRSFHP